MVEVVEVMLDRKSLLCWRGVLEDVMGRSGGREEMDILVNLECFLRFLFILCFS